MKHPLRIVAAVLCALVMLAFYTAATRALSPYNVYLPLVGLNTNFGPTAIPTATRTATATRTSTISPTPTATATATPTLSGAATPRPFPDTSNGIFVLNDQLAGDMSDEQFQFAATHYVGTQKVTRADARHLRQYNPNFIVLHYRLGQALGYRSPDGSCNPTGTFLEIIDGDQWVREWPGSATVQENWFFHWNGSRVFNCSDGHYLMELNDAGWRSWWTAQVIQQLQDNEDDGVFADSYSPPNYFGGSTWKPPLPGVDDTFEAQWAAREHAFTDYVRAQFAGRYYWIPNVGMLVTNRDPSDYGNIDGGMVEGFGEWGGGSYFDPGDWELQMNRVLALENAGKVIIAQNYPNADDVNERVFLLGSYLLIKGAHTYINLDLDLDPEWFPEYALDLGPAGDALPADIATLYDGTWNVYRRNYQKGLVLVNPGTTSQTINLGQTMYLATPAGGGFIPADGQIPAAWRVDYAPVTSLTLPGNQAAVLLDHEP